MTTHRITDEEMSAVLRGQVPAGRDDLEAVAKAVTELRRASFEGPPQPTAALALRLDLERATRISTPARGVNSSTVVSTPMKTASMPRARRKNVGLSAFAGLGLAAKIALGAGAAAAVGVTGAGAAGAAGVLPADVQVAFNQFVGVDVAVDGEGVDEIVEQGTEKVEDARAKAEQVREAALDEAEQLRQAGVDKAEELRQAGVDKAEELRQAGVDKADELSRTGVEKVDELSGSVVESVEETGEAADEAVDVVDETTGTVLP